MALKDFPNKVYLIPTLGGGVAIIEANDSTYPPTDGVLYIKTDSMNSLLSKAYNAGLENKKGFIDMSGQVVKE